MPHDKLANNKKESRQKVEEEINEEKADRTMFVFQPFLFFFAYLRPQTAALLHFRDSIKIRKVFVKKVVFYLAMKFELLMAFFVYGFIRYKVGVFWLRK